MKEAAELKEKERKDGLELKEKELKAFIVFAESLCSLQAFVYFLYSYVVFIKPVPEKQTQEDSTITSTVVSIGNWFSEL